MRPLAGDFAFMLFALGILGVGLIGVPVLAGSAAYALSEAMGWKWGLERKATDARGFYGVIAVSVLAGLVIQYSPISPMKALFWSAVINGVVAVPLMVVIILLVSKKSVMGAFTASRSIIILGWIATAVMGVGGRADVHPRLGCGRFPAETSFVSTARSALGPFATKPVEPYGYAPRIAPKPGARNSNTGGNCGHHKRDWRNCPSRGFIHRQVDQA